MNKLESICAGEAEWGKQNNINSYKRLASAADKHPPPPCDCEMEELPYCKHRGFCRRAGRECPAARKYYDGRDWSEEARDPYVKVMFV